MPERIRYAEARLHPAGMPPRQPGSGEFPGILIEHPSAPSYGSTYPFYASPETPLTELARACGGRVIVQGANPEEGSVPDADWIKILDAAGFVRKAMKSLRGRRLVP